MGAWSLCQLYSRGVAFMVTAHAADQQPQFERCRERTAEKTKRGKRLREYFWRENFRLRARRKETAVLACGVLKKRDGGWIED